MKVFGFKCKWYNDLFYLLPTIAIYDQRMFFNCRSFSVEFRWMGLIVAIKFMERSHG